MGCRLCQDSGQAKGRSDLWSHHCGWGGRQSGVAQHQQCLCFALRTLSCMMHAMHLLDRMQARSCRSDLLVLTMGYHRSRSLQWPCKLARPWDLWRRPSSPTPPRLAQSCCCCCCCMPCAHAIPMCQQEQIACHEQSMLMHPSGGCAGRGHQADRRPVQQDEAHALREGDL